MNERFEVYASYLPSIRDGIYKITWAKEDNLIKACFELMHGRIPKSSTYRYGLFGTGDKSNYTVKRKNKSISEQEQDWEEVAMIERV